MTTQEKSYTKTISAPISIAKAIDKINDVAAWWSDGFSGSAAKTGDTFKMDFGQTFVDFKVSDVTPDKLTWEVTDCFLHFVEDKTEWNGTTVTWELSHKDGQTEVVFTHHDLTPKLECFEGCNDGWNRHLASLEDIMRGGEGQPLRLSS